MSQGTLVCVECGTDKEYTGQESDDTLVCDECGYESAAYMFDPHELMI